MKNNCSLPLMVLGVWFFQLTAWVVVIDGAAGARLRRDICEYENGKLHRIGSDGGDCGLVNIRGPMAASQVKKIMKESSGAGIVNYIDQNGTLHKIDGVNRVDDIVAGEINNFRRMRRQAKYKMETVDSPNVYNFSLLRQSPSVAPPSLTPTPPGLTPTPPGLTPTPQGVVSPVKGIVRQDLYDVAGFDLIRQQTDASGVHQEIFGKRPKSPGQQ